VRYRAYHCDIARGTSRKPSKSKLPIDFGPDLYTWLQVRAPREGRSLAAVVRQALLEYRDRVDPQLTLPLNGGL